MKRPNRDWWAVHARANTSAGGHLWIEPTWHPTEFAAEVHIRRLRIQHPGTTITAVVFPLTPLEISS